MAKQGRSLPARRQRSEESLLLRSAESLGRIIGSLQRELDDAGAWFSKKANGRSKAAKPAAKSAAEKKTAGRRSGVRKAARNTTRGG
jgi:hypothetical protein